MYSVIEWSLYISKYDKEMDFKNKTTLNKSIATISQSFNRFDVHMILVE